MLEFIVPFNNSKPKYLQLYDYIKHEIIENQMKLGSKLPSSRMLSTHLGVSRNTILSAYELLLAEGYIVSRQKSGYYVTEQLDIAFMKPPNNKSTVHQDPVPLKKDIYEIDFKYGHIDRRNFPYKAWKTALTRCLPPKHTSSSDYGNKQGELPLRRVLSEYIYRSRGVHCTPEQIVITSGTQMSLDHICRLTHDKFSSVAMENPGYIGGKVIFELNNVDVLPIHLKKDGIDMDELTQSKCKLALVTPSHQFPLGMTMSVSKRIEVLKWANEVNGYIIENDYEGEFSHSGQPIASLQSYDNNERVIYLYNFSGSLLPGARMSFYVLPNSLIPHYQNTLGLIEQSVPVYQQNALEDFILSGEWEKHIRRMRKIYKSKHVVLRNAINTYFGKSVEPIGNAVGLHLLLRVHNGMDENTLIETALVAGVKVYTTSQFWIDAKKIDTALVLIGFGNTTNEEITKGIALLKHAWFGNTSS